MFRRFAAACAVFGFALLSMAPGLSVADPVVINRLEASGSAATGFTIRIPGLPGGMGQGAAHLDPGLFPALSGDISCPAGSGACALTPNAAAKNLAGTTVPGLVKVQAPGCADNSATVNVTSFARTCQKLATPQMFGAVGDGVADDTAAVTGWLAAGGGYAQGKFKLTSLVTVAVPDSGQLVILGAGRQSAQFLLSPPQTSMGYLGQTPTIQVVNSVPVAGSGYSIDGVYPCVGGTVGASGDVCKVRVLDLANRATATAFLAVQSYTVTNPGAYSTPPTATVSGGGCTTTPTATVVTSGTSPNIIVTGLTVNAAGVCTGVPTVAFSGTGTAAAATASMGVGTLTVTYAGDASNPYPFVPRVAINGGGCYGVHAIASMSGPGTGTVVGFNNIAAGVNCTSQPTVRISAPPTGPIASAQFIEGGDYSTPPASPISLGDPLTGTAGTGAKIVATAQATAAPAGIRITKGAANFKTTPQVVVRDVSFSPSTVIANAAALEIDVAQAGTSDPDALVDNVEVMGTVAAGSIQQGVKLVNAQNTTVRNLTCQGSNQFGLLPGLRCVDYYGQHNGWSNCEIVLEDIRGYNVDSTVYISGYLVQGFWLRHILSAPSNNLIDVQPSDANFSNIDIAAPGGDCKKDCIVLRNAPFANVHNGSIALLGDTTAPNNSIVIRNTNGQTLFGSIHDLWLRQDQSSAPERDGVLITDESASPGQAIYDVHDNKIMQASTGVLVYRSKYIAAHDNRYTGGFTGPTGVANSFEAYNQYGFIGYNQYDYVGTGNTTPNYIGPNNIGMSQASTRATIMTTGLVPAP